MDTRAKFTHLHTHSEFSLLDGLAKIPELVEKAHKDGQPSLAITDHGNMHGAVYHHRECKRVGIKPIIGMEAYLATNKRTDTCKKGEKPYTHLTLLCKNMQGYKNLMRLSTISYTEGFYYKPRIDMELLTQYRDGIVCLSGCLSSRVSITILEEGDARPFINSLHALFGRDFYLEIQRTSAEGQEKVLTYLKQVSKETGIRTVATNDVHYTNKEDWEAHEALLCIGTGTNIFDPNRFRFDSQEYYLRTTQEMVDLYKDCPEAIDATQEISDKCNVELEDTIKTIGLSGIERPQDALEVLCQPRGEWDAEHGQRLRYELSTIGHLGFADYILIVYDFVRFAKAQGIAIGGGRGSSAGSLVCYLLGITSIDPIKHDLVFERFINPERVSMPDIDVDIEPSRRHEVINYLSDKYGMDRVAQITTFGTMKTKAAIKDCARVLQLKWGAGDALAKEIPDIWADLTYEDALKLPGFQKQMDYWIPDSQQREKFLKTVSKIEGKVRHSSTHAAGVVISTEPIVESIPLCTSKDGSLLSQYDMYSCENIGLVKFDLLGLKTVACIDEAARLAGIDIEEIDIEDKATYRMLNAGKTIGVFQYEGTGITKYLREFRPSCFNDLVLINALYRPGPLDSGMAREFIKRRHSKNHDWEINTAEEIRNITKDTHGIMVFQEQVMKLAVNVAGFTMGRADVLRKAMGKKDKHLMSKLRNEFISGAVAKGFSKKHSMDLFHQIETFARYGWNRAHAVVYSLISYRTAFLRCHFPIHFFTALLNNEDDKTRQEFLISEAVNEKIKVIKPHINVSDKVFISRPIGIYQSLSSIKGVGHKACDAIIEERKRGVFKDAQDFRARIQPRHINSLVFKTLVDAQVFREIPNGTLGD